MKKRTVKALWFAFIATILLYSANPANVFAAEPIGAEVAQPTGATQLVTTSDGLNQVSFQMTGTPVFASNAPETIWDGPRSFDGVVMNQVNKTLYRDYMTGNFRFWSVHVNQTGKNVNFYMHVYNTSADSVKLYIKRSGYGVGGAAAASSESTNEFMSQTGSGGTLVTTIPTGGFYTYPYSTTVAHGQTMSYIADFRVVNVRTGADERVSISDVVTNDGTANINTYATSTNIAKTNYLYKDSADDYRGVLAHSGRTVDVRVNLSSSNKKFMKIADSEPTAYPGEQERLKSRFDVYGVAFSGGPKDVVFNSKYRGAYWVIDYTYNINITKPAGFSVVSTYYGQAPGMTHAGFINYKISALTQYHYNNSKVRVINNNTNYTLQTMVQPSLSLPLALYFIATN
ncbi:hypothetical protein [Paenibacillus sp. V4I5]|uniref:hypothetical protein n=1 Tax=Paenibacillus sp. V4I5 TaxID=3042306 RepID=UPI00278EDE23|nr:hypothetical protein [Paenibacillus sp. V4I5]MDQ0917057.1 hypothetical protein [Paenibacillus sp. V4I5]